MIGWVENITNTHLWLLLMKFIFDLSCPSTWMCIVSIYYFITSNLQLPILHFIPHTFQINSSNLMNSTKFQSWKTRIGSLSRLPGNAIPTGEISFHFMELFVVGKNMYWSHFSGSMNRLHWLEALSCQMLLKRISN